MLVYHTNYFFKTMLALLKEFAFFPLWWYSRGLYDWLKALGRFLADWFKYLAIAVWVRNLFVPMYGQSDIQGRLVSIFMRLVQIVFRSVFMLFLSLLAAAGLIIWLAAPIYIVYQIIFQLSQYAG